MTKINIECDIKVTLLISLHHVQQWRHAVDDTGWIYQYINRYLDVVCANVSYLLFPHKLFIKVYTIVIKMKVVPNRISNFTFLACSQVPVKVLDCYLADIVIQKLELASLSRDKSLSRDFDVSEK